MPAVRPLKEWALAPEVIARGAQLQKPLYPFRLRSPPPTRENRAHCHPILPKPGKMGALALVSRSLAPQGGLPSALEIGD